MHMKTCIYKTLIHDTTSKDNRADTSSHISSSNSSSRRLDVLMSITTLFYIQRCVSKNSGPFGRAVILTKYADVYFRSAKSLKF